MENIAKAGPCARRAYTGFPEEGVSRGSTEFRGFGKPESPDQPVLLEGTMEWPGTGFSTRQARSALLSAGAGDKTKPTPGSLRANGASLPSGGGEGDQSPHFQQRGVPSFACITCVPLLGSGMWVFLGVSSV